MATATFPSISIGPYWQWVDSYVNLSEKLHALPGEIVAILTQYSRYFLRQHIHLRPRNPLGLALPMRSEDETLDVQTALERALNTPRAVYELQAGQGDAISLVDIAFRDDMAILLFRRSDSDAATQMFENRRTRILRRANRGAEDNIAASAHLFVDLHNRHPHVPTYRAILEEVPGLNRTFMESLLRGILREEKYEFADHRGEAKETYTMISIDGVASETVGRALRDGTIQYVQLVRTGSVPAGIDTEGIAEPKEEILRLAIRAERDQNKVLRVLSRFRVFARDHDYKVSVRLRLSDKRTRDVALQRQIEASDTLFVHAENVRVEHPMDSASVAINNELAEAAAGIFRKHDWLDVV